MSDPVSSALQTSPAPSLAPVLAPAVVAPTPRYRTFTFGIGFLCGQASLIFVAVLFLRYVVFEDPKVALREAGKRKKKRLRNKQRQRRASVRGQKPGSSFAATTSIPVSDQHILSKLSYDLSAHPAESCDWLNVLIAQAVSAYRSMILDEAMNFNRTHSHDTSDEDEDTAGESENAGGGRGAKRYVEKALNTGRGEGEGANGSGVVSLDYITVTEFDFGQEYPVCSNARVRPGLESGKVRIEVDIDYSDHVSLAVETKVLLNFPRPRFAIIPVNLALALVQFSATLTIEVPPPSFTPMPGPESSSNGKASMSLSLHPDFVLELASTSLIGSRAKLQDIPKVEQLIIGRIRSYVIANFVWPKVRTFNLPSVSKQKQPKASETKGQRSQPTSPNEFDNSGDYDYITVNGEKAKESPSSSFARSPSSGSAIDEEEEEDEFDEDIDEVQYVDDSDLTSPASSNRMHIETSITRETPSKSAGPGSSQPPSLRLNAYSSALHPTSPTGLQQRRPRRTSSLSSSTTASDLVTSNDSRRTSGSSAASPATVTHTTPTFSPPSSRSGSVSAFDAYREQKHRPSLQSPGLGASYRSADGKRHTLQSFYLPQAAALSHSSGSGNSTSHQPHPPPSASSSASAWPTTGGPSYSAHALSRTSSVTSLPTILSPRAEQPSSRLAHLLNTDGPRWEATRRAADERRRHQHQSQKGGGRGRKDEDADQQDLYASPGMRGRVAKSESGSGHGHHRTTVVDAQGLHSHEDISIDESS